MESGSYIKANDFPNLSFQGCEYIGTIFKANSCLNSMIIIVRIYEVPERDASCEMTILLTIIPYFVEDTSY